MIVSFLYVSIHCTVCDSFALPANQINKAQGTAADWGVLKPALSWAILQEFMRLTIQNLKTDLCFSHFGPPWFCHNGRKCPKLVALEPRLRDRRLKRCRVRRNCLTDTQQRCRNNRTMEERTFMVVHLDSLLSSMLTLCSRTKWGQVTSSGCCQDLGSVCFVH